MIKFPFLSQIRCREVYCFTLLLKHSLVRAALQGSADREGCSSNEHHPQHLQSDPKVPWAADRTVLGEPAGGDSAPQLHCHAAVLQHLQILLTLSVQR